jgi:hypothetical protein
MGASAEETEEPPVHQAGARSTGASMEAITKSPSNRFISRSTAPVLLFRKYLPGIMSLTFRLRFEPPTE